MSSKISKRQLRPSSGVSSDKTNTADKEQEGEIIEDCGSVTNPFLIDIVIQRVLQFCDPEFLFTCRLVCTQWESEAWRQIQLRRKFSFCGYFDAPQKICRVAAIPTLTTWRSLHLCKMEFTFFVANNLGDLRNLLAITGHCVKELSLQFRDLQLSGTTLVNTILRSTPNLQRLALKSLPCEYFHEPTGNLTYETGTKLLQVKTLILGERCHYSSNSDSDTDMSVRFFSVLLSMMPNIEKLDGRLGWGASSLIKALEAVPLPNLSHLRVVGAMTRQCAETLENLRLKTLYLGVSAHYNEDSRHNVIFAQRHSIQTLGVGWASFHSRVSNTQLQLEFPELRCLSICDYSKWKFHTCPQKYLDAGVGLQKLRVDIRVTQDFDFLQDNLCFQNVKDLDISFCVKFKPHISHEENASRLRSTFPQVRILTVRASENYPFGFIFKYFEDIEKLSIIMVNSTTLTLTPSRSKLKHLDSVFVGLPERHCKNLRKAGNALDEDISFYLQRAEAHLKAKRRRQASNTMPLSNLQSLKKLIIVTGSLLVSNVTVQLCLWILPKLISITIDRAEANVEAYLKKVVSPAVHLHIVPLPGLFALALTYPQSGNETKYELD